MASSTTNSKVLGATLLIAGSCIGAAMLGMPVITANAGFFPSLAMLVLTWFFMLSSGFLLLEVNLWMKEESSLISMTDKTLGFWGKAACWGLYLFLFSSLMVAYSSGSGQLLSGLLQDCGWRISQWQASILVILLFLGLLLSGTRAVDLFNRFMMTGLVLCYFALVFFTSTEIQPQLLTHMNWSATPYVLPALIVSFGYHQLVPTLTTYLDHDAHAMRKSLWMGSLLALAVYLLWQLLILGVVPLEGEYGLLETYRQGGAATQALRHAGVKASIIPISQYFALFAILTSFVGVALSFVDFLLDGFGWERSRSSVLTISILILLPPFVLSQIYPRAFLLALDVAGGFGAVILYGLLPAMMVWKGRTTLSDSKDQRMSTGKGILCFVVILAITIFSVELFKELGIA